MNGKPAIGIVPEEIDSLKGLIGWMGDLDSYGLTRFDEIVITPNSKLQEVKGFKNKEWKYFRGVPIKYE